MPAGWVHRSPAPVEGVESAHAGNGGYSDRYYFRVRCPDHQVFDLSYDAAQNVWILKAAHDELNPTPTPRPRATCEK